MTIIGEYSDTQGKKYDSIEESPVKFQKYKRNLEPQHLYLHGDLQPQVELAPTKNNQGIQVRHGRTKE